MLINAEQQKMLTSMPLGCSTSSNGHHQNHQLPSNFFSLYIYFEIK
jgi:hypothetical protein